MSNKTFEYASDTRGTTALAAWIARGNGFFLNGHPSFPTHLSEFGYWATKLSNGRIVSVYPIANSITAAPFFKFAYTFGYPTSYLAEGYLGKVVCVMMLSIASALIFVILRTRYSTSVSFLSVLFLITGSMLFSRLSQSLWNQSVALFLQALSMYFCKDWLMDIGTKDEATVPSSQRWRSFFVFLGGSAAVWAGACRPSFFLWALLLGVVVLIAERKRFPWFMAGSLTALSAYLLINYIVYGSAWGLYQDKIVGVQKTESNFFENLLALTWSPGRGLFLYSPWLLLSVAGMIFIFFKRNFWKTPGMVAMALFCIGILCALSVFGMWWGGHSNGPRLQSDVLLCATLLAAYPISYLMKKTLGKAVLAVLLFYSAIIQLNGSRMQGNYWEDRIIAARLEIPHMVWDWNLGNLMWIISKGRIEKDILKTPEPAKETSDNLLIDLKTSKGKSYGVTGFRKGEDVDPYLQMGSRQAYLSMNFTPDKSKNYTLTVSGYDRYVWGTPRILQLFINGIKVGDFKYLSGTGPGSVQFSVDKDLISSRENVVLKIQEGNPPLDEWGENYMYFTEIKLVPQLI